MTLTIELPDALASQLMARTTEEERNAIFTDAAADALNPSSKEEQDEESLHDGGLVVAGKPLSKEEQEAEERWIAALNAIIDPEKEPERDAAEVRAILEAEIADMEAGRGKSYTQEEMQQMWDVRKAELKAKYPA